MLKTLLKLAGILFSFAILVIAAAVIYISIQRSADVILPAPSGKYLVGRQITTWTDASRAETLGGTGGPRKLSVWMWYPAAHAEEGMSAPYMPPDWAQAREADRGVGSLFLQSTSSILTHSVEGDPMEANGPYPVLIFEPGLGPLAPEYTTLAEDLASQGYVVIGLNPTYSASLTVIDGQVIPRSDAGTILDDMTPEQAQAQGDKLVAIWAADDRFAIDQLAQLNVDPAGLFQGMLDMEHIGIWGHSLGGASALEACHLDVRCDAAADLDGTPFGTAITEGLDKPALFVWSEVEDRSDPMIVKADRDVAAIWATLPEGYQVTIKGARHFNFSDFALGFNPLGGPLGVLGPIDPARGLRISADYLEAFFGMTLKGQDSSLLQGSSTAYPEVEFVTK